MKMRYGDCTTCGKSSDDCMGSLHGFGLNCCSPKSCEHPELDYRVKGRRFYLNRKVDDSGVSGTGVVAEGWVDPHGECIVVWVVGEHRSTEVHSSAADMIAIHGHGDHTEIVWVD